MTTHRIVLRPKGDFSLAAAVSFLAGFTPLQHEGGDPGVLRLAFPVAGDWRPAAVEARQDEAGAVHATVHTTADVALVSDQLERMLSLDVDATGLPATVAADPVAERLVADRPGLRPACFASPYEAATWAVLSQRVQMKQAAGIRRRISERLGHRTELGGVTLTAFPDPETLRVSDDLGVPQIKVERLHALAEAALDGRLDAAVLRAAGPEQALADLRELPGIGEFSAELVLIRGAGEPDWFSRSERRLHGAMAKAYDLDATDIDALTATAKAWTPFRSWIGFLFRSRAEATRSRRA